MRVGAAHQHRRAAAGQGDVVAVAALAAQQHRVLLAPHRLSDRELLPDGLHGCVHRGDPPAGCVNDMGCAGEGVRGEGCNGRTISQVSMAAGAWQARRPWARAAWARRPGTPGQGARYGFTNGWRRRRTRPGRMRRPARTGSRLLQPRLMLVRPRTPDPRGRLGRLVRARADPHAGRHAAAWGVAGSTAASRAAGRGGERQRGQPARRRPAGPAAGRGAGRAGGGGAGGAPSPARPVAAESLGDHGRARRRPRGPGARARRARAWRDGVPGARGHGRRGLGAGAAGRAPARPLDRPAARMPRRRRGARGDRGSGRAPDRRLRARAGLPVRPGLARPGHRRGQGARLGAVLPGAALPRLRHPPPGARALLRQPDALGAGPRLRARAPARCRGAGAGRAARPVLRAAAHRSRRCTCSIIATWA